MTLSIWRYAHLALALCSSIFLIVASLTGAVLAVDAIDERISLYGVSKMENIDLAATLEVVAQVYPEITELSVNHHQALALKGYGHDGKPIHAYINPHTGEVLGTPIPTSNFMNWILALHRSLFLHNLGRIFIAINSFLLFLIAISGIFLVIQRQNGIRHFFKRLVKEDIASYFHVVSGRILLLPIVILALSGTYLSLIQLELVSVKNKYSIPLSTVLKQEVSKKNSLASFAIFQQTRLVDVQKLEFPFFEDPEEYFKLNLKDKVLHINQFKGAVVGEQKYPFTAFIEHISLDLHTGRTNILWALILLLASINILFFIYSGFVMTLRRRKTRIKNKYKAQESEYILLVGSENGSTLDFAVAVQQQLLAANLKVNLIEMNKYTNFPNAKHLVVFTSTHGMGDAPSNASSFLTLLEKYPQKRQVFTSVVGFGSTAYPDFCGFAKIIEFSLSKTKWAQPLLPLYTVNDKMPLHFTNWVKAWNAKTILSIDTNAANYNVQPTQLLRMKVCAKTALSEADQTFSITFKLPFGSTFTSGDLLAIYPANDGRERLYSIGKVDGKIHLLIKLHKGGLGSEFLNELKTNKYIKAKVIRNTAFHFPKAAPSVMMISNGTGMAPFLGMIAQNKQRKNISLFAGFRKETTLTQQCYELMQKNQKHQDMQQIHFSYSRQGNTEYVMDALQANADSVSKQLKDGACVMICGSLAMQCDVEKVLDSISRIKNKEPLSTYKKRGQLMADCY